MRRSSPRPRRASYPPGSLLKPFTIVPSLENGVVDANSVFPYEVTGNSWKPDGVWYWDRVTRNESPDGPVNLEMAFRFSDNIYFSWATLNLGQEKFLEYMNRIGIDTAVPFDLPTAKGNLINEGTEINRKLVSDMSFGHGEILLTPIQAASMYTVFQNNGDMLAPSWMGASANIRTHCTMRRSTRPSGRSTCRASCGRRPSIRSSPA